MKVLVNIILNPNLLGLDCKFPTLPFIAPSTIIKVEQQRKFVYVKYEPSSQLVPNQLDKFKAELPSKLCEINGITPGIVQVQPIMGVPQCQKLSVYVSPLDWQIINNQAAKIEEEFMNQIRIVWPQAKIPLYYDRNNAVNLRIVCERLSLLASNAQLQILVQQSNESKGQGGDSKENKQKEKEQILNIQQLHALPGYLSNEGNINKIYLPKSHPLVESAQLTLQQHWKQSQKGRLSPLDVAGDLNNRYQFKLQYKSIDVNKGYGLPCDTTKISIKEQINMIKNNVSNRENNKQENEKILEILVEVEMIENEKQSESKESEIMKEEKIEENKNQNKPVIYYLNETMISHWGININKQLNLRKIPKLQQKRDSKKLEYLLNSLKGLNIQIYVAEKEDRQQMMTDIKNAMVDGLLNALLTTKDLRDMVVNKSKSISIYSKIPYIINGNILAGNGLKFERQKQTDLKQKIPAFVYFKNNNNIISDPLTIISTNNNSNKNEMGQNIIEKERDKIKTILLSKVKVINYYYDDQSIADIKTKVQLLSKMKQILNIPNKNSSNDEEIRMKKNYNKEEMFIELYKISYQPEIDKIISILKENQLKVNENQQSKQLQPQIEKDSNKLAQNCAGKTYQHLSILITSFTNNGKTIMNSILRQHGLVTLYIDLSQLDDTSLVLADIDRYLQLTFQLYSGQLIFMDNLDSVCYKIQSGDLHRKQQRIAAKLIIRKILEYSKMYNKICIFTCKSHNNLDEQLSHYQLVKLKNPNRELRQQIIKQYYEKLNKSLNQQGRQKIQQIINNSQSMSFGQFSKYVIQGHKQQPKNNANASIMNFSKLAGVKQAKRMIKSVIQKPLKYSFVYKKLPIKLSRGILLYGGSGTGKTAIGEALADQFMMKFFSVKGSDILSKYIGGSEAAVRDVFEKAMSVSPSIVFFDQFETIVPRRNSSNTGVTDRVVNQFLCYLDGVASVQGVYIMASSSRPDLIDPALLRPGRIDTHIFLDYPNAQQRQQLFQLYESSIKFQTSMEELIKITQGFSYSDLIGLIKQLRIKKSAEIINKNSNILLSHSAQKIDANLFKEIDHNFLMKILETFKISVSKDEQKRQREKYLAFKRGDAPDISKQKTMLQ